MNMNEIPHTSAKFSSEDLEKIEFDFVAYDLHSGIQQNIQTRIRVLSEILGRPGLGSLIYTIAYELAANGMKALYKHAFYDYLATELGWGDIPYEHWLKIFKTEIASNKAENFAHICRTNNLHLRVLAKIMEGHLRLEVINDGVASKIEMQRLENIYRKSRQGKNLEKIIEGELLDPLQEEDGLGIPLIILTLKGLKIPVENFQIIVNDRSTIARVDFPLSIFHGSQEEGILFSEDKKSIQKTLWHIFENLEYSTVAFKSNGEIKQVSGSLPEQLGLTDKNLHLLPGLIKESFFEDIFMGPFSVENVKKFENYRLNISSVSADTEYLFNISGCIEKGEVLTLWQKVNIESKKQKLSEGSLFENIHIQKLIAPYIPQMLLDKARETIHKGLKSLPSEDKEATLLFADVIGFTGKSQSMPHNQLIDLLNLIMGIVVHSIEKNSGYIDKFLGDGVMCIFLEPLSAIVAAIEIQNNLFQLNEFRVASGAEPLNMRIGINSGQVILGSIGTKKRMDWTALGDVVNTASRIEKLSRKNSVLISNSTYLKVKDLVTVKEDFTAHIRGKLEVETTLYFINSVSTVKNNKNITMSLFETQ